MKQDEIIIRKGIVHILDGELGYPVFSEETLSNTPEINDFFRGHLYRLLSGDDLKKCRFSEEEPSEIYRLVREFQEEDLVPASKRFAEELYQIMNANQAIPSGDLAVLTFQTAGEKYLAMLKLNYKQSYVHMTQDGENGNVNEIVCYRSALPPSGTGLSEAVIICLEDYSVQIVERKYEINGKKINYLSELFLKCSAAMSQKTKLAIVTKTVEQLGKKHYAEEPVRRMEAKSILKKEIEDNGGALHVEEIGRKLYGTAPEVKEEFDAKMEKYHMGHDKVSLQSEKTVKKMEKQYLKTDTGIEINIPMEQYQDANQVEFITNPDGTVSVLIKNINQITTK